MKKVVYKEYEISGIKIPFEIHEGGISRMRVSIGKEAIKIGLSSFATLPMKEKFIQWSIDWVKQKLEKDKTIIARFSATEYITGSILDVGKKSYPIVIEDIDEEKYNGELKNGEIRLSLFKNGDKRFRKKAIKTLISRLVAKDQLPAIQKRVEEINSSYFKKEIKKVRLKYNSSNWGSCSSDKNINLSTRLLFAPDSVIDYVIVHELAHLIELNHSNKFWEIVSKVMPDYTVCETWLKKNGNLCDF